MTQAVGPRKHRPHRRGPAGKDASSVRQASRTTGYCRGRRSAVALGVHPTPEPELRVRRGQRRPQACVTAAGLTLDATVSPPGVLACQAKDQLSALVGQTRTSAPGAECRTKWGFPPAGERWRPISAVFPCSGGQTARTPPMPASTPHGLPSPSSVALTEILSSRVPRCRGGCRAEPHPPPGSSKPWTAFTQRSFAPGACCCSPIIAPTTSAARLSATLQFPVLRLYGEPCHAGAYWLRLSPSPFHRCSFPTCNALSNVQCSKTRGSPTAALSQFFAAGNNLHLASPSVPRATRPTSRPSAAAAIAQAPAGSRPSGTGGRRPHFASRSASSLHSGTSVSWSPTPCTSAPPARLDCSASAAVTYSDVGISHTMPTSCLCRGGALASFWSGDATRHNRRLLT